MRNALVLLSIVLAAAPVCAQPGDNHEQAPAIEHELTGDRLPWTSDKPRFAPKDFQFVVVSDNTGSPRPGIFKEAMEKADLLQPAFVISVGDLIEGYVDTEEELNAQWDEFMSFLDPLSVPFFFVPGNHDVGRKLWHDVYLERVGPSHYYFVYQDVLFLVINSNDNETMGTGYGAAQLAWVKEVLDKHPDVRWTYVFQHKPFWLQEKDEWAKAAPLFEGRKHTFFAGHIHNYAYAERGNIQYVTLATTGGGSAMRGAAFGEFDHLMWVTVTDEGPKMAAIALDGIFPADFRTPEIAAKLRSFRDRSAVTSKPVLLDENSTSAAWEISITNPWDKPLRFKGMVEGPDGLSVTPSSITVVVPPESTLTKTITVSANAPLTPETLQPIAFHWTGIYDAFNAPPMQFSDIHRLLSEGKHEIVKREGVVVDGKLDEWGVLPYEVLQPAQIYTNELAWKGPQDLTYRFGLAHDGTTLFAALEVDDDDIKADGVKLWQDFALIFARAAGADPAATPLTEESIVSIVEGPDISLEEKRGYETNDSKHIAADLGGSSAFVVGEGRITYEFAIPLASLTKVSGASTEHIQFNIGVNDYDPSDARLGVSLLNWRPSWTGGAHFPESGIFSLK
jgi:predicted phosphodiesterase